MSLIADNGKLLRLRRLAERREYSSIRRFLTRKRKEQGEKIFLGALVSSIIHAEPPDFSIGRTMVRGKNASVVES